MKDDRPLHRLAGRAAGRRPLSSGRLGVDRLRRWQEAARQRTASAEKILLPRPERCRGTDAVPPPELTRGPLRPSTKSMPASTPSFASGSRRSEPSKTKPSSASSPARPTTPSSAAPPPPASRCFQTSTDSSPCGWDTIPSTPCAAN